MTTLICSTNNKRDDFPQIDMHKFMENEEFCGEWNKTVCTTNIVKLILLNSDKIPFNLKVRCVIHENITSDEVRVSGNRSPIQKIKNVSEWKKSKQIVDILFSIDPTNVLVEEQLKSCIVEFPNGVFPICYTSENCEFSYISAIVEKIELLAIDITPISYTLLWGNSEPSKVTIGGNVLEDVTCKLDVINSEPGKEYEIKIQGENTFTMNIKMPELTVRGMRMFYMSKKQENGSFDLSRVNPEYIKFMRKNDILDSGNNVFVKGQFKENNAIMSTTVLNSGDIYSVKDECGLYVVPDFTDEKDQHICIENKGKNHTLYFDKSESFVKYNDVIYPHNKTFRIGNNIVSVVKGSIILSIKPVTDTTPNEFPGGNTYASQILTSGDMVVKDVIARSTYQVVEKVAGSVTYNISSYYVYDSSDSTTLECSRISHGLSDDKTEGSVNFSTLFTNGSGTKEVVETINSTPTSTVITARTTTDTLRTTFDNTGLSFDTDTGAIYFGADKDFRIQFEDASGLDPAMLKIQRLDGTDYSTSFLVTAEAP